MNGWWEREKEGEDWDENWTKEEKRNQESSVGNPEKKGKIKTKAHQPTDIKIGRKVEVEGLGCGAGEGHFSEEKT